MAKRLNYIIGVDADTSKLQVSLNKAFNSLNKIGSQIGITDELKNASKTALELSNHLDKAFNKTTGKLDLSIFNQSLAKSGRTLESYAEDLIAIGSSGESAFLKLATAIGQAELPIKRTNKLFDQLWTTMKNTMRWQLTSSTLHTFIGTLEKAYSYAKDLNKSLNNIRIVTNKSTEDMAYFADQANKAAKALSTTTTDYTDASLIYYQQGLTDKEVQDRTDVTIKMANVAGITAETASQQLTAIWNNFYDGSKSLEYYADVMVKLSAATASSSDEISEGIEKFAAVANTVGLSYDYAATALATVTAQTRESANIVGTAFRTLFSRIQGLQQGETLDDGTTLNKYSEALAKVGVNIKDTNGDLKGMDDILDELGAKWNTLAQDQKIALAETVAGVRQWTQLIALMDNWDFFQENLALAQGSSGTLGQQAKIYEESWMAARKRIQAAAQDIYNSLINPDFFIEIDKIFTSILNRVADVTDALGGLKGILALVTLAVNKIYGDKIASGLKDLVTNLGIVTGKEAERARILQQEATTIVDNLALHYAANEIENTRLYMLKQEIALQGRVNAIYDNLNASQKDILADELYKLDILKQQNQAILERASSLYNTVQESQFDLMTDPEPKEEWQSSAYVQIEQTREKLENLTNNPYTITVSISDGSNVDKVLTDIFHDIDAIATQKAPLQQITNEFTKLKQTAQLSSEAMRKLVLQYNKNIDVSSMSDRQLEDKLEEIKQEALQGGEALSGLGQALKSMGFDSKKVNQYILDVTRMREEMLRLEKSTEEIDKAIDELFNKTFSGQVNWAEVFVQIGTSVAQLSMLMNGLNSAFETFEEISKGNISGTEAFTKVLSSLVMVLTTVPTLIKHIKIENVKNAFQFLATGAAAGTGATGVASFGTALSALLPVVTLVVAALYLVIKVVDAIYVSADEAREKIQQATDAYEEQKSTLESLNSELETTRDRIKELNNQDKLTIVEQSELKKLKQQEVALERQAQLQERIVEAKEKAWALTYQENAEKANSDLVEAAPDTSNLISGEAGNALNYIMTRLGVDSTDDIFIEQGELWLETWKQEQLKALEDSSLDAQTYKERQNEILTAYNTALKAFKDGNATTLESIERERLNYTNEYGEGIQKAEEEYSHYIDLINRGKIRVDSAFIKDRQEELSIERHGMYSDEDYNRIYLNPLAESLSQEDSSFDLYQKLSDDDNLEKAKELLSDDFKELALAAGIDIEEFLNYLNIKIDDTKQKVKDKLGKEEAEKFDFGALSAEDWNVLINNINLDKFEGTADELLALIREKKEEIIQEILSDSSELASQTGEILKAYQNGEELTDEQLQVLDALCSKYTELNDLRIQGGHEYLQTLREIQEKEEQNHIDELKRQEQQQQEEVEHLQSELENLENKKEKFGNHSDLQLKIDAKTEELEKKLKELTDTRYEINIAVNADLASDVDQAFGLAGEMEALQSYLSDGLEITYDKAQEIIAAGYGALLTNATETANGTILINENVAKDFIKNKQEELKADRDSKIAQLENERTLLVQKQTALQQGIDLLDAALDSEDMNAKASAIIQATKLKKQVDATEVAKEQEINADDQKQQKISENAKKLVDALGISYQTNTENFQQSWSDSTDAAITAGTDQVKILNKLQLAAINYSNAIRNAPNGTATYNPTDYEFFNNVKVGASAPKTSENTYELSEADIALTAEDIIEAANNDSAVLNEVIEQTKALLLQEKGIVDAQIGSIDAAISALKSANISLDRLNLGKDGKNSKEIKKEEKKDAKEAEDRYHNINRQIERQKDLLDDLSDSADRSLGTEALNNYEDKIKGLEKQQELLNEKRENAKDYLSQDLGLVKEYFQEVQIGENGEITNYEQLRQKNVELYNAAVDRYNLAIEDKNLTDEQLKALKEQLDTDKDLFDKRQKALDQYEETIDVIRDTTDEIEENLRNTADEKLGKIKLKMEIVIETKSMRDAVNNLSKEINEMFGDALTHGVKNAILSEKSAQAEAALLPDYQEKWKSLQELYNSTTDDADRSAIMDEIQNLQGEIANSAKVLAEWANSIEDIIPEAISAASERFTTFTDQLEHNTSILDTIKELYTLQGVTYKTAEGFNHLQKNSQEKLNAQLASAKLQRGWYERAAQRLEEAQAKLDSLGGDETDLRYDAYKKARDAYLEEFNEAQEAYLSKAQETMETAKEIYILEIEKAIYSFQQVLAGTDVNLDLLQDKYDHYIETEGQYFDKVNEAYQVSAWYNKLQKDIDDTANTAYKERLKALQEEINSRKEGNKLSQYDLDILNAKYQVLQAQMALEDAQNTKNKIQLVRDSQGNWNYQYTADQDQIADAQQNLLNAQNEWYNVAKDRTKEVAGEIVSMWKDCTDEIEQLYKDLADGNITEEEYLAKKQQIEEYYTERAKYLEEQKTKAITDMNEAGYESLKKIAEKNGETVKGFENVYANELNSMTESNKNFADQLDNYLQQCDNKFNDYQNTVKNIASETGSDLDNLAQETDKVTLATEELTTKGKDAITEIWKMIEAAEKASEKYTNMALSIWKVVDAYKNMVSKQADFAESESKSVNYDLNTDYSDVMLAGVANGWIKREGSEYKELEEQRNAKKEYLLTQGYTENQLTAHTNTTNAYKDFETWKKKMQELGISGFATGGYTGLFDDAKLAFLHQKELVLNQTDTENILAAVRTVRDFGSDFFSSIEKALDSNAIAAMALMGQKLNPIVTTPVQDSIEQTVHIDKVEFPNVTSRTEIEEAFVSLTNDAAQWARRKS